MKQLIVSLSVATALCSFASSSALAQMKVGIVDMNKVFTSYYKTKDAEARLNDARAQAKTDLDGRLETLKSNMEAIKSTKSAISTAKSANSARPASANCRSSLCACAATSCRTS
jgi:Skp family chaperone for outer membrane proteins